MKTKITSIALLVLAGLFTSTESVKAYINMPDDLTWDASVGIFPVITQPAAAYYTAQRAYESAKSAYDPAKSAYDSAKSAYDSAKSAYDSAKSTYDSANISPEAALSSYQATLSAYQDAEAYYIWSYINDPGSARASYDAYVAAAATRYSAEATYNIFLGNYEAYNTTQAAYNATQTVYNATQAVYNTTQPAYSQSLANKNAAISADPFSSLHIAVYSSQKIFNLAKSAYDSAKSAYDSAKSAYDSAKSTYDSANISPEAALSSYQATLSAYQDAEAYYIWSYINDPGSARASYDAYVAAAATRYSAEATYNIFLGNYEAYNTTQAAYNATQTVYNATQAVYNESISTLRASVSSANAVPEPSTYGLIGIGALSVAFAARRRKVKAV